MYSSPRIFPLLFLFPASLIQLPPNTLHAAPSDGVIYEKLVTKDMFTQINEDDLTTMLEGYLKQAVAAMLFGQVLLNLSSQPPQLSLISFSGLSR